MKIHLETERLYLREFELTDLDPLFELDSDPLVHQYLGNKPLVNKQQVEDMILHVRQQYVDNGIGRWAMIEKTTGSFIGWSGLKLVKDTVNNHTHYHDLGYRLLRKFWNRGFATESAVASLAYGFATLELPVLYAAAHVENVASNKILQKLGFQPDGTFMYDTSIHNWYFFNKNDYRSSW